jgi:hypothetical protein
MMLQRFLKAGAFLLLFALCVSVAGASDSVPAQMSLQVAKSQIREAPTVVSPIIATVVYGSKLLVYGNADGWAKVQVPGSTRLGYIFLSALTEKKIAPGAAAGAAAPGVSGTEIALAGKGFNETVESSFRQNTHVDYSWVDAMEKLGYPQDLCVSFLDGGVGP